jgi:DNA polymerase-3 subunit beta
MTTATAKAKATTIGSSQLAAALGWVSRAVKPHVGMVTLGRGKVVADNGTMVISVDVEALADAEPLAVNHEKLTAIAKAAAGEMRLKATGSLLTITAGRGEWSLPAEQGAIRDEAGGWPLLRMPPDQLERAIGLCLPATDAESSRYALGGILIEQSGGDVSFVATDGRRLHVVTAEIDQAVDDRKAIVPASAAAVIAKAARASGDQAVQICVSRSHVTVTSGPVTVTAALLQGNYPRWRDVVPKEDTPVATVSAGDLLAAVRQSAIVTSEQSKSVTFTFGEDSLTLRAKSAESGTSEVKCDVKCSVVCSVRLDPSFVAEWLSRVDQSVPVSVVAKDGQSAVVFVQDDATAVVMPMAED